MAYSHKTSGVTCKTIGNLKTTTKFTTTKSVDCEKTGTRTSFSAGKKQRRLLSDWSVGNHSDACALPPIPVKMAAGKNRIADRFSSLTKRIDRLFFFLLFLDANFLLAAAFLMAGNGGVYFLQASRKLFFNMRRACKRLLSQKRRRISRNAPVSRSLPMQKWLF